MRKSIFSETRLLLIVLILFQLLVMPAMLRGGLAGIKMLGGGIISLVLIGVFLAVALFSGKNRNFQNWIVKTGFVLSIVFCGLLSFNVLTNPYPFGPWTFDHYSVMGGGHEVDIGTRQSVFLLSSLVNMSLAFVFLGKRYQLKSLKTWISVVVLSFHFLFVLDVILQPIPQGNFGTERPIDRIEAEKKGCYYRYRFMFLKMRYECDE